MVASNDTVNQIYKVLEKYLTHEQIVELVRDLKLVDGNRSFEQTVERLWQHVTS